MHLRQGFGWCLVERAGDGLDRFEQLLDLAVIVLPLCVFHPRHSVAHILNHHPGHLNRDPGPRLVQFGAMVSEAYVVNARLAAGLSTLCAWLCLFALVAVATTHHPTNHIALDIRVCYVLAGAPVAAALLGRVGGALRPWSVRFVFVSGVMLAATVFVLDQWNMVVGFEEWIDRGQPKFGVRL